MEHVWAQSGLKWKGFRFTEYGLLWDKVEKLPLKVKRTADGKTEVFDSTLGEIYARLADVRVELDEPFNGFTVKTQTEELHVGGPGFNVQLLHVLLELRNEKVHPLSTRWFWYDHNSCLTDPHELYTFFIAGYDKIVREHVTFSDYHNNGFDPRVFDSFDSEPTWSNEEDARKAQDLFWYRKFLRETQRGQIMALRADKPEFRNFTDQTHRLETGTTALLGKSVGLLNRIHALLWVLVAIGALALIHFWH